jgi:hypothetical protein
MPNLTLTDSEAGSLRNALYAARDQYLTDARMFRNDVSPPMLRLAEQFERQAADSVSLAQKIEGAR